MKNITSTIELKEHCGTLEPKDPWKFAKDIQNSQECKLGSAKHSILFNKGRYFETSLYNEQLCKEISELIQSPIKYNNMIVDSWLKLEDFVIAMNCLGIYVIINIDWI
jgi:hypothetical protein